MTKKTIFALALSLYALKIFCLVAISFIAIVIFDNEQPQEQQEEESRGYTDEDAERLQYILDSIQSVDRTKEQRQQAARQTEQQQDEQQLSDEQRQRINERLRAIDNIPLQVK